MSTAEQLTHVFNDNFVAYFHAHVAHVNIEGRNFQSDHKLLQKVYEDLQDQIDVIAELLRTMGEYMPSALNEIIEDSEIPDINVNGTADELLALVRINLMTLKGCYDELIKEADSEGYLEIANYAQDRVLAINKFLWMLNATLN